MTAETLKKYRTINYDTNGKPVSVLLDLKNKQMRKAFEKWVEEIDAEATFEMIERVKNDPDNEWTDFFEVANEILATKKV